MALIDSIKLLCDRLSSSGWRQLLLDATNNALDISQATPSALLAHLTKPIPAVNRNVPGFADFCPAGPLAGIMPGNFARSVLYHALASPLVHPVPAAGVAPYYPSLQDLDQVENLIFAAAKLNLKSFLQTHPEAQIVVFAYQYRSGGRSPHRRYADMAWSRTGVARTGVSNAVYDERRRSWRAEDAAANNAIAVLPARYAAWLAVHRAAKNTDVIMDGKPAQGANTCWWPVHKIFSGSECFTDPGFNITLDFAEFHVNEKLRSVHTEGGIPINGFDLEAPPFSRNSVNQPNMVSLQVFDGSAVLTPNNGPLVEVAKQGNRIAHFTVPARIVGAAGEMNRFNRTSLLIPSVELEGSDRNYRIAPEYVNIRHRFNGDNQPPVDLGNNPDYLAILDEGEYEAVHFIDHTCDGAVLSKVRGIDNAIPLPLQLPAFSLVTAPDFFPLVDQADIFRWVDGLPDEHFRQGSPQPLSQGVNPVSLDVLRPGTNARAFSESDATMTYVNGYIENTNLLMRHELKAAADDLAISWLTDAASNMFAPGWDVSLTKKPDTPVYLSSRGLGSPFPEDAKLCAMLNSFWPAVAPDASRTFGAPPTAIPMLDSELGLHPLHPSANASSKQGWDGEYGPFFESTAAGLVINHANVERSDYVSNALANKIHFAGLNEVSTAELLLRMEGLRACIAHLPPQSDNVPSSRLILVQAERVGNWSGRPDRLDTTLNGEGLLFVFALPGRSLTMTAELTRVRRSIENRNGHPAIFQCQIAVDHNGPALLVWQQQGGGANIVHL